jgi:hypothetical protein
VSSTSWAWFHDGLGTVCKFDVSRFDIESMLPCFEIRFDFKPGISFNGLFVVLRLQLRLPVNTWPIYTPVAWVTERPL